MKLKKEVFSQVKETQTSPAEKDDTDTQLALVCTFECYPEAEITLIGATGGRLDHLLANLWLGLEPRFEPFLTQIKIADKGNIVSYIASGNHTIKKIPTMKYLAFCCLTPVKQLTLKNVKYELSAVDFLQPTSLASNEFLTGDAEVNFSDGLIAVIQSKDV